MSFSPANEIEDYRRLLGVNLSVDHPNLYELLDVPIRSTDLSAIEDAIRQKDERLRAIIQGPDVELAQSMLNELAAARIWLLDGTRKAEYDKKLLPSPKQVECLDSSNVELKKVYKSLSPKQETRRSSWWMASGVVMLGLTMVLVCFLNLPGDEREQKPSSSLPKETGSEEKPLAKINLEKLGYIGGIDFSGPIPGDVPSHYPKIEAAAIGSPHVARFDGEKWMDLEISPKHKSQGLTIAFVAAGSGVLLSTGDPHMAPGRALSVFNKGHMRVRLSTQRFCHDKKNAETDFTERMIVITEDHVQFFARGLLQDTVEFALSTDNMKIVRLGKRLSSDSRRESRDAFRGSIGEVLIFDSALDHTERSAVSSYLESKWTR